MRPKVTIITGTPCTGKTTVARALAKKEKAQYIDVKALVKKHSLAERYDRKRKSQVVDTKKLNKILIKIIKATSTPVVIDSHMSHYLPKKWVDWCIVTKTQLNTLKARLKKRGYTKTKVQENLDCEIFDICRNEAGEAGHTIQIMYT